MQSFGRASELQATKLQEVAARSPTFGKVVAKMLTKNPAKRISSMQLVDLLGGGSRRSGEDDSFLELLDGVSKHEIRAVHALRRDLDADDVDLIELPDHIGGGVALLRLVREHVGSPIASSRAMFEVRGRVGSAKVYREIVEGELSLHSLPGTAALHAATWQTNEWLSTDTEGDVVVYERFGAIDPTQLIAGFSSEQYARWCVYRYEARAALLDSLSRRAQRVVWFTQVIDVRVKHNMLSTERSV